MLLESLKAIELWSVNGDILPEDAPGARIIDVHPDLYVVETDRSYGNTDPRFDTPLDVIGKRAALVARIGCQRLVSMVPQIRDQYFDLDQGIITPNLEGYSIWPSELQPKEASYNPTDPFYMTDLPRDGLVTQQENVGLFLGAADCAPTLLYDPIKRVLSLIHIGREGAVLGIGTKMLEYMGEAYGTKPEDVVVYSGPAIAPESYILPRLGPALQKDSWKPFIRKVEGQGYAVDFVGYAQQHLAKFGGVPEENITSSGVNVAAADSDYFSLTEHLVSGTQKGRNGFMVVLQPKGQIS